MKRDENAGQSGIFCIQSDVQHKGIHLFNHGKYFVRDPVHDQKGAFRTPEKIGKVIKGGLGNGANDRGKTQFRDFLIKLKGII